MNQVTLTKLTALLALAVPAFAQTSPTGYAPGNFGNFILTSTPSNATGNSGVSTVYTSSGNVYTFGTGGSLVNPMQFNYTVTGPNTATIKSPASASQPAATTNLVFTTPTTGTYTTEGAGGTSTGQFHLAEIPGAAPLSNVSARTVVGPGNPAIIGFVIAGTMPRRVLIRADGPALTAFGVANALAHPSLALYSGQTVIARNSAWGVSEGIQGGATGSAAMGTISTGTLSTGTSLGTTSTSTTSVGTTSTGTTSGGTLSGGTTSIGSTTATVTAGTGTVTGTTVDGVFTGTLPNGSSFSTQLATPADFAQVGAFGLTAGSQDDAIVAELPPGAYTVAVNAATATVSSGTLGTTNLAGGTRVGGTSSGTGTTLTGTGTTSGGTSSGGTTGAGSSTVTGSTTGSGSRPGTTTATATTTGDVLVEVYFLQ